MSTRGVEVRGASGERLRVGWMVTVFGVSSIESAVLVDQRDEEVSTVVYV